MGEPARSHSALGASFKIHGGAAHIAALLTVTSNPLCKTPVNIFAPTDVRLG